MLIRLDWIRQAGFFAGTAGAQGKVGVGLDGKGQFCFTMTMCSRMGGGGMSAGVSCGAEYNSKDFEEGDSPSGGIWGNAGWGPFGTGSISTRGDNVKVSGTIGGGAGLAGGGQACATRTFCVNPH